MFFIGLLVSDCVQVIYLIVIVCGWDMLLYRIGGCIQWLLQDCIQLFWVVKKFVNCLVKYCIMLLCFGLLCISMLSLSCFCSVIILVIFCCIWCMYLVLLILLVCSVVCVMWIVEVCGQELIVVVGSGGRCSCVFWLVWCWVVLLWWVLDVMIVLMCVWICLLCNCGLCLWDVMVVWDDVILLVIVLCLLCRVCVRMMILCIFLVLNVSQFCNVLFRLVFGFSEYGMCSVEYDVEMVMVVVEFSRVVNVFNVVFRLVCQMLCLLMILVISVLLVSLGILVIEVLVLVIRLMLMVLIGV